MQYKENVIKGTGFLFMYEENKWPKIVVMAAIILTIIRVTDCILKCDM